MTFRSAFDNPFPPETERFGVITGTLAFTQFPNVPGKLFRLKCLSNSIGAIFMGNIKLSGTSAALLPWELAASEDTGWFSANNLNQYAQKGSSGSAYLAYWVQG